MLPIPLALCAATALLAQAPVPPEPKPVPGWSDRNSPDAPFGSEVARLLGEIEARQQAWTNLEELTDDLGPRLTGSDRLRKAQAWAMDKLRGYGAVAVGEESYAFGPSWTRGRATARLLNGNGQTLLVAQGAWSPGTPGPIRGEVVGLKVASLVALEAALPALAGKLALMEGFPKPTEEEKKDPDAFFAHMLAILDRGAFGALLISSGKKNDLLAMGGSPEPGHRLFKRPMAFLAEEHADLVRRLLKRGRRPELELELGGACSEQPVEAFNVVAELKGSERPEEVVIVAGHLDSWDLGTGATDNGTGTVAAMEVLRAMAALGLKPRRTLRVVLFSGEEQGLLGSTAYVKAHAKELDRIQAVLVDDMGSGRITGWPDMGKEAHRAFLAKAMAPVNGLGCVHLEAAVTPGDSDHWPFHAAGVPAFFATQEPLDYMATTHHSQTDTLDHVVKADLVQGCQVMAAMAWELLNCPDRMVHGNP